RDPATGLAECRCDLREEVPAERADPPFGHRVDQHDEHRDRGKRRDGRDRLHQEIDELPPSRPPAHLAPPPPTLHPHQPPPPAPHQAPPRRWGEKRRAMHCASKCTISEMTSRIAAR